MSKSENHHLFWIQQVRIHVVDETDTHTHTRAHTHTHTHTYTHTHTHTHTRNNKCVPERARVLSMGREISIGDKVEIM